MKVNDNQLILNYYYYNINFVYLIRVLLIYIVKNLINVKCTFILKKFQFIILI